MTSMTFEHIVNLELDDSELVELARAGDREAMEVLYRRHAARLEGLAWRIAPRDGDADDILQDAFVQAFTGLDRLGDPQAFGKWLTTILVRCASRRLRRIELRRRLGFRALSPLDLECLVSTSAPPDVVAELRGVYSLVDSLPTDERIALVLQRVEGYTIAEISEYMSLSPATVKRRLKRATVRLERVLSKGASP